YIKCILFCFFFQAEDGIRDFHVTGVQTCALPICLGVQCVEVAFPTRGDAAFYSQLRVLHLGVRRADYPRPMQVVEQMPSVPIRRSEERRVGKECRTEWAQQK